MINKSLRRCNLVKFGENNPTLEGVDTYWNNTLKYPNFLFQTSPTRWF